MSKFGKYYDDENVNAVGSEERDFVHASRHLLLIRFWEPHVHDTSDTIASLYVRFHDQLFDNRVYLRAHVHVIESFVDVVQSLMMGDEFLDPKRPIQVV